MRPDSPNHGRSLRGRNSPKTVRFAASCATTAPSIPCPLSLTDEEISHTWYSVDEHEKLKNNAHEDTRRLMMLLAAARSRRTPANDNDGNCAAGHEQPSDAMQRPQHKTAAMEKCDDQEDEACYRGLEHRVAFDRMHRRRIAIRSVLVAQSRLRDGRVMTKQEPSVVLALVAQKLTRSACELAQSMGQSDSLEAYRVYTGQSGSLEGYRASRAIGSTSNALPRKRNCSCSLIAADAIDEARGKSEERRVRMRINIGAVAS